MTKGLAHKDGIGPAKLPIALRQPRHGKGWGPKISRIKECIMPKSYHAFTMSYGVKPYIHLSNVSPSVATTMMDSRFVCMIQYDSLSYLCVCDSLSCMCVCVSISIYLSIYLSMDVWVYVSLYVCIYVSMYLCIYV